MTTHTILIAFWVTLVLLVIFVVLATVLQGSPERWAIVCAIFTALGVIVSVVALFNSEDSKSPTASPSTLHPGGGGGGGGTKANHARPLPLPGITSLPPKSPLRRQIVSMDQICANLGIASRAWLPGQESANNLAGRRILGRGTAYTWSCSRNGPKLTVAQITQGCQIWYPGKSAYTWDPSDAYSWVCL